MDEDASDDEHTEDGERRGFRRTRHLKWLPLSRRRSGVYDEYGNAVNSGMRVWYEDYTTIDWIHDHVKERVRMNGIRSRTSLLGRMLKHIDAVQAWIVLTIIGGRAVGAVASFIDVSYSWLNDLKYGYCSTHIMLRHSQCTQDWITWPSRLVSDGMDPALSYTISYTLYVAVSVAFAVISAMFVMWSATSPVDPETIAKDAREAAAATTAWNRPPAATPGGTVGQTNTAGNGASMARTASATRGMPARAVSLTTLSSQPARKVLFPAGGSGVPEVKTILGGFVIRGFLGVRTLVTKTIGLIFSIASGLVIGMQGPLVHITCSIGNVMSRLFVKYSKNEGKRREIMSAAAAAGVSVAFGAPIGGVLFSLEEVSYYFPLKTMWRSFYCALIAAVTLKLINPLGTGKLVMFQVTYDKQWHPMELIPFFVLGIFGGLFGALFIRCTTFLAKFKSKTWIPKHPVLEVFTIALATSALSYIFPLTRTGNGELVASLFSECEAHPAKEDLLCHTSEYPDILLRLIVAMFIKLGLMIITFGIRVPAGIFVPSMVVGACAGRVVATFGLYMQQLYPDHPVFWFCEDGKECIIPGVYAMVGAAAALSGVTRMTVSLTIIMFELTGALTYVLPLMVSIMVAKWVGDAFSHASIYDVVIERSGYPYLNHKRTSLVMEPSITAGDMMIRGGETLSVDVVYTVADIERKLQVLSQTFASKDSGLPVLKANGILVGFIAHTELEHALSVVKRRSRICARLSFTTCRSCDPPTARLVQETSSRASRGSLSSLSSVESGADTSDSHGSARRRRATAKPVDISQWVDQMPLTVSEHTSIELVLELFVKLGVRTLSVVTEGRYVGIIHKKRLLVFLSSKDAQRTAAASHLLHPAPVSHPRQQ
ncbi:chloride channel [Entophlyctis helioformis]|nr:chloride channel [Entophlyctis helioformis]